MNLPAEIFVDGKKHVVAIHDLSLTGLFVRASDEVTATMQVGSIVHVALAAEGRRVVAAARITHALTAADARALGRYAGIGLELCEAARPTDHQFGATVAQLVERCERRVPVTTRRIVVADPETRMLERLSVALGEAGFSVATATNGMEALSACMRKAPDVVLLARDMPVVDGFRALAEIQRHPRLAGVPVIITSDDPADLVEAFELGAMDFITRPFSSLEVVLRARRLAHVLAAGPDLDLDAPDTVIAPLAPEADLAPRPKAVIADILHSSPMFGHGTIPPPLPAVELSSEQATEPRMLAVGTGSIPIVPAPITAADRVMLRGDLALVCLPALLTLVEHERKSGRLELVAGYESATIELLDGRIVRASATAIAGDTRAVMLAVLDWTAGEFILVQASPAPASRPALGLTHLLLEHARLVDEASQRN